MKTTNETCCESNYSSFFKEANQKNSLGYFPLLKFKENLYSTCQSKFSEYINSKKDDIKLIINNKINQQISIDDYIHNSSNDIDSHKLTPIPSINKRKIKNEGEKKELKKFQRNVVLMRRLEYANKMKEKNMKKKYKNNINQIINIQKMIRGYLVRKVINQVNIINDTLNNFIFLIAFCIKKKYFFFFKNAISLCPPPDGGDNNLYEKYEKFPNKNNFNENLNHKNNANNNYNNNGNTIKNELYDNMGSENKLSHNNNFFEEEKNNDDNDNEIIINKIERLNVMNNDIKKHNMNNAKNLNNNKNSGKQEKIIYNKINKSIEEDRANLEIKEIKTNTNINNNENNNVKEKRSMAKLTEQLNGIKNENNESITLKDKNLIKYNSPNNIDSIIENDDYVDFSIKNSKKKNKIKDVPNQNPMNYILSDVSQNNLRKTKTETIQRQFRQYLYKKGYYGNFDKRKIAIIYLIKNMILYNVKLYIFNIFKMICKDMKNASITQEDNYYNISSERIQNVKLMYDFALNQINLNFN
jgi:hypothetical protein